MKILMTGGHGQIAYEVTRMAIEKKYSIFAPSRQELDITDRDVVINTVKHFQPDIVINTAAYTKVDLAEKESEYAYAVNREGAKNIAIACSKIKCPLLHLSTDYVFDGKQTRPYLEVDPVAPLNIYGTSKWQGEEAVRTHGEQHIILRVSGVFGTQGVNFVKTILRLARDSEELRIVADQMICPTPAKAIAETLLKMLTFSKWGTYHYCSAAAVTWYDFAKHIIQHAQSCSVLRVKSIVAISSVDYPTLAQRPLYSVLNCTKLEKSAGIQCPNWEEGLKDVITTLSTP